MIKPIPIQEVSPTGIDGADVYIADQNYKLIFFIGSLYGSSLWDLHTIIKKLKLTNIKNQYITKIDYACKLYLNTSQANDLKKEIEILRQYSTQTILDKKCLHNLDVLETAADFILQHKNIYIYIIGD